MKLSTLLESTTISTVDSLADLKRVTEPVNVTGSVNLSDLKLARLPVKFGEVEYFYFYCSDNKLTSLEGAPSRVHKSFLCNHNLLTSLEGAPSQVRFFYCNHNQLTSLVGIHKIIKSCIGIDLSSNPIKEGGLGLLLIKGLDAINVDKPAFDIIAKYLGKGKRGMIDCQQELIKAGYKDFARL